MDFNLPQFNNASSMILKHYNLREQPFGVAPNPRFIFQGPGYREALASLIYAIESNAGFAALIGRAGLGKTTLIFHLLEYFRQSARIAVVFNTQCSRDELLRYILADLGETRLPNDVVLLYESFRNILTREVSQGRRVIIIIDEAQNLALDALEAIRLLNNFETPESKLLHIILVGQQQLATKLMHPAMEQLMQRITMICRLTNFQDIESIDRYICHRLRTAGYDRTAPLFSTDAIAAISEKSDGVPRRINRLCFNALLIGCALDRVQIDAGIIEEVSRDLDLAEPALAGSTSISKAELAAEVEVGSPSSTPVTLFENAAIKQPLAHSLPISVRSSVSVDDAAATKAGTVARIPQPPDPAAAVQSFPVPDRLSLGAEGEKAIPGKNVFRDLRNDFGPPRSTAAPAVDAIRAGTGAGKKPGTAAAPGPIKNCESPYPPLYSTSKIPLVTALLFATLIICVWYFAANSPTKTSRPSSPVLGQQTQPDALERQQPKAPSSNLQERRRSRAHSGMPRNGAARGHPKGA